MLAKDKIINFIKTCKGFDSLANQIKILSAGNGACIGELKIEPDHVNYMGGLHGGFSATLIDLISSLGLITLEKERYKYSASVNMNLSYLKSATIGDEIIVDAKTVKAGRHMAFLEVNIINKSSRELLVRGLHTKYILDKK